MRLHQTNRCLLFSLCSRTSHSYLGINLSTGSKLFSSTKMYRDAELQTPGSTALGTNGTSIPHRIVIAGGSYGGVTAAMCLLALIDRKPVLGTTLEALQVQSQQGIEITLIDERDGFFHTVGAPLAHVAQSFTSPFWKSYHSLRELQRPEFNFIRGSVQKIDAETRSITFKEAGQEGKIATKSYDYFISATGLRREWPVVPRALLRDEYMNDAENYISSIKQSKEKGVIVIGGGAVGIEFAGEIKNHYPELRVTLIHSRSELLSNEPLPQQFKLKALEVLQEEGVEVILGQRPTVEQLDNGTSKVLFKDGTESKAGFVLMGVTKVYPSTEYLPETALNEKGFVKISADMTFPSEVPNHKKHFAIGDITQWALIKRAGGAIAHGKVAALNIFTQILQSENPSLTELKLVEFPRYGPVMGLAVGKQAIGYGGPETGVQWGVDQMERIFGKDLGWSNSLRYIGFTSLDEEARSEGH